MEALSRSEQIRKDLGLGQLFSPEQMRQAIIAQARKKSKVVADAEDGHIGTPGVSLTKDLVFQGRSNPLVRGFKTLLTHGSGCERDDILVSIEETTKMETVYFPGYVSPEKAESGFEADACSKDEVSCSVAVYTDLPPISEVRLRKLLEKGFKSGSSVALDINVQSHVGQKTPIVAFCAIMDSYSNNFSESLQVGLYLNLAEGTCKALTVPLVNFPLSYELDMVDDYLKRLYLVTYFYNSRGFRKGMPMFSYGIVGFSEFKPSINNLDTRVSLSWDRVKREQLKGERVVSGLNLITHIQKDNDVVIPDVPSTIFVCRPLSHPSSSIKLNNDVFDVSSLAAMRSGSLRAPNISLSLDGIVQGRKSIAAPIVSYYRGDPNIHSRKDSVEPHFSTCVAEGPDFTTIVYPTLVQGNMLTADVELEAQIQELYGDSVLTFSNLVPKSFNPEDFVGTQLMNYEDTFLRAQLVPGTVLVHIPVRNLLNADRLPLQMLQHVLSGVLALEVKADISLVKSTAFTLKLCYDEANQVAADAVNPESVRPLPGIIFSSQENSGVFSFSLESLGHFVDLSRRTQLGNILLVAWSRANLTTADIPQRFNYNLDIRVAALQSYTYSVAQGPICNFAHANVHLTLDSAEMQSNRHGTMSIIDINPWHARTYVNAFQAITQTFEGYVADFIISWHLAVSAFSAGKLYVFPVYDQQLPQNISKVKLDQAGIVPFEVSLVKSGKIRIPFHSWYGSYSQTRFPRVGFYAPAGISGPEGEMGRLSIQVDAVMKFSGRGLTARRQFDVADLSYSTSESNPVSSRDSGSSGEVAATPYNLRNRITGQSPYNYVGTWLHAATTTRTLLGRARGVWHIPVSPFNMAIRVFDANGLPQFNHLTNRTDNWLHLMTRSHLYWRGSLTYQFRINYEERNCASHPLVAYYSSKFQEISGFNNPPIAATYSTSFCTGNCFVLEFEVPFYATSKWLHTIPDPRTDYGLQDCFNGMITFQLPANDWMDVQIWVKPGADFMLNRYRLAQRETPTPATTNSAPSSAV